MPSRPPSTINPIDQLSLLRGWNPDAVRSTGAITHQGEVRFPMRNLLGQTSLLGWRRRRGDNEPFQIQGQSKKALTLAGGHNGVIYPYPLAAGGTLLVFEGEADLCAALTARPGAACMATPGATPGPRTLSMVCEAARDYTDVVLFCDPDEGGALWAYELRGLLGQLNIKLWAVPPQEGLDTDKRLKAGQTLEQLIDSALPSHAEWPWATQERVERIKAGPAAQHAPRPQGHASWLEDHPHRAEFDSYLENGWAAGLTTPLFFRQVHDGFWIYTLVKYGSEAEAKHRLGLAAAKHRLGLAAAKGVDEKRTKSRQEVVSRLKAPKGWDGNLPPHQRELATTTCGLVIEPLLAALKQELKLQLGADRHASRLINGLESTARWILQQDPHGHKPVIIGIRRMESSLTISHTTAVKRNILLRRDFPLFKLVPWDEDCFFDKDRGLEMRVVLNVEYAISLLVWSECPEKRSQGTYKPRDAARHTPDAQRPAQASAGPKGARAPRGGNVTECSSCTPGAGGPLQLSPSSTAQNWSSPACPEAEDPGPDSEPVVVNADEEEADYLAWCEQHGGEATSYRYKSENPFFDRTTFNIPETGMNEVELDKLKTMVGALMYEVDIRRVARRVLELLAQGGPEPVMLNQRIVAETEFGDLGTNGQNIVALVLKTLRKVGVIVQAGRDKGGTRYRLDPTALNRSEPPRPLEPKTRSVTPALEVYPNDRDASDRFYIALVAFKRGHCRLDHVVAHCPAYLELAKHPGLGTEAGPVLRQLFAVTLHLWERENLKSLLGAVIRNSLEYRPLSEIASQDLPAAEVRWL